MILKVTILFAVALLAAASLRRATAATRHALLAAAQIASLALPLLAMIVPTVPVDAPDDLSSFQWSGGL